MVDFLLGQSDANRIKECMEIVRNNEMGLESRVGAFEMLESLLQCIDNAQGIILPPFRPPFLFIK